VSSQYISGLLFALPLLEGDSFLQLTGNVESRPYIDMTLDALRIFGIDITESDGGFIIPGKQHYHSAGRVVVEGDWSNAAFWLCAGAIGGGPVTVTNLNMNSIQGDKACVEFLEKFGANIVYSYNAVTVSGGHLRGIEFDAKDTPDLVPVFALVACAAEGRTVFKNAQRLRIKESDRLKTVHETLAALGADVTETDDGLIVNGAKSLHSAAVESFNDHRIAMTAAVASQICSGGVEIKCAEAVAKSYPDFYRHYENLGGTVTGGI
jgi:3-phosphoshikimate 1-carboxyvinyltransferase